MIGGFPDERSKAAYHQVYDALLVLDERSPMHDSAAVRKRLGGLTPHLQVEVVDGVGHDMDLLAPGAVGDRILRDSLRA